MEQIAQLQINELKQRLAEKQCSLIVDPAVVSFVAQHGYEKEYGARPLKRAIQQYLSIPISQYLLKNKDANELHIALKNDTVVVS